MCILIGSATRAGERLGTANLLTHALNLDGALATLAACHAQIDEHGQQSHTGNRQQHNASGGQPARRWRRGRARRRACGTGGRCGRLHCLLVLLFLEAVIVVLVFVALLAMRAVVVVAWQMRRVRRGLAVRAWRVRRLCRLKYGRKSRLACTVVACDRRMARAWAVGVAVAAGTRECAAVVNARR